MGSKWKEIWPKRSKDESVDIEALKSDPKEMFLYMKKLNGFDIVENGISYEGFMDQHKKLLEKLCLYKPCKSVFEIGCGSGGNLYLFSLLDYRVGGIDYSQNLLDFAKEAIDNEKVLELICNDAVNASSEIKYDACFSNSVFSYFADYDYAQKVLEIMNEKCRNSIVLIDVHDLDKKQDFIDFRRKTIENYDEKYSGLPKLFYPKSFFEDFGKKHGLKVVFYESDMKGYWNNDYVYNVCLYK
ncbi:MAG TPA: SAM-dependent methyltransferase [Ruminococcaceae bacterium]|nr:SAM-dependent methyltransferase [Oscillospiraceae bacterium]